MPTQSSLITSRMMSKLQPFHRGKESSRSMVFFIDIEDVFEER